jgi:protein-serine/threonine kinase
MLYHLATGHRPFGQPSTVAGLRKRLFTDPVPPRALKPDCPPWLQEVILRCLEVKPERRYQSAAQLALDLQHPEQVALTRRAHRLRASGLWKTWRRRFAAVGAEPSEAVTASRAVRRNPILMAAIDLAATPALLEQLRVTVERIASTEPGARVACVAVMRTARLGMDELVDAQGQSLHLKQLIGLKHWARPLAQQVGLDESRLTFHVLESPDPANALVEFARRNEVDHLVMGARGNSALRRYLGSVSSQVVAECPCTVTVVRANE